jgi:hypothetical protein
MRRTFWPRQKIGSVTYTDHPVYLFSQDAYISVLPATWTTSINGAGASTPWGVFNTIPPS